MNTIYPVSSHTDHIGQGSTFVAIPGYTHNGIDFIPEAIHRGATTIIYQEGHIIPPTTYGLMQKNNIVHYSVPNARITLAELSAQAAGHPAKKLCIIGITGTKGKTSTTWILHHLLTSAGYKTALLSTVENKIIDESYPTFLTTAQADYLHQFFALCVKKGITHVVMEVAAQAISTHRIHGIEFSSILFTNFDRDHLEFYPTLEDYFDAKLKLFHYTKHGAPLIAGADHSWAEKIIPKVKKPIEWVSNHNAKAKFYYQYMHPDKELVSCILYFNNTPVELTCPNLIGTFNNENMVCATSMALSLGIPIHLIQNALKSFTHVPGRLQQHALANGAIAIIDYAHNSLSFNRVLPVLKTLRPHLIVVFGAGGQRDAARRIGMGNAAAIYADTIVLTNDNPRNEDPLKIMNDIISGIPVKDHHKIYIELDREKAIKYAYTKSNANSIIALLGKGTETYQLIGTQKYYFNEVSVLKQL